MSNCLLRDRLMDWIKNAPNFFLFSGVFRCPRQYFLFKVFQMFSRPWIFWSSCSTYLQTIFPTDPPTWFSLHHTFVTNETVLFDIIFNLKDNLIFLEFKTCNVMLNLHLLCENITSFFIKLLILSHLILKT